MSSVLRVIDRIAIAVAILAVLTLLVDLGWIPTLIGQARRGALWLNAVVVCLFLFENFAKFFIAPSKLRHMRSNLFDTLLAVGFIAAVFSARYFLQRPDVGEFLRSQGLGLNRIYLILGQAYIILTLVSKAVVYQKHLSATKFQPAVFVLASFVIIILMGAVLLSSPQALTAQAKFTDGRIPVVDSLFTATSAVCVTGLVVKDTGSYFSTFGQIVILCLIQIGGLGLMTFVTFASLVIGKGMGLSERVVMQDVLSYEVTNKLPRLITYILVITLLIEGLGAFSLYGVWQGNLTVTQRVYLSIFHSVSAYCNAGFCLFSTSFVAYRGSITLNAVITGLIIFGGLGFVVQQDLAAKLWYKLKKRLKVRRRLLKNLAAGDTPVYLSLQSKIVLLTTGGLLLFGIFSFGSMEWYGALEGMTLKEKLLSIWFQSVTPRTAGFNTVSFSKMATATYLVIMALMFIGASPGGTGGGVKTSTFAILVAAVRSTMRNRMNVELCQRTIPLRSIRHAFMVVLLAVMLVLGGAVVLSILEPGIRFERLLFEQISALGTVGLSTGAPGTPLSLSAALSPAAKVVIMVTMLAGRIGQLMLAVSIAQKSGLVDYEYPTERVVIG